jgi:hypothetical protein
VTVIFWIVFFVIIAFGFVVFFGAPYVPSRRRHLEKAFDTLYKLGPDDVLLDLGAGDGVVLRAAARRGARAIGYELNPILVWISRWLSRRYPQVTIKLANIWRTPFPGDTTVVYIFGDARDIARLTRRVENEAVRLKHSLYVISYGFELPGHKARSKTGAYHLYEVKALQAKKAQV